MTISLPSKEIFALDLPEISDFSAEFKYNFFVPDESVNDSGGIPKKFLSRPAASVDTDFIQYSTRRAPRFVTFAFTPVKFAAPGGIASEIDIRENSAGKSRDESLISRNLEKIMTEDAFASNTFTGVSFHDGAIQDKLYALISASAEQHLSENEEADNNVSSYRTTQQLSRLLPRHIKPHLLGRFGASLKNSSGAKFFSDDSGRGQSKKVSSRRRSISKSVVRVGRSKFQLRDKFHTRLNNVKLSVQINSKMLNDIVDTTLKDPGSPFTQELTNLHNFSKSVSDDAKTRYSLLPSDDDYKTLIEFIEINPSPASDQMNRQPAEVVGYIIDKVELTQDNTLVEHDPIVIENPDARLTADYKVKYGSRYKYAIRTIAKFRLPAIDDDSDEPAEAIALVSSKQSNIIYVDTIEEEAPPPPADVNFRWNYETDKLHVTWNFPTNSQRDIKKFQIFRRSALDEPFELMKMYDFDDSLKRWPDNEEPDPTLIEFLSSPKLQWIDDDFDKNAKNQNFIYSIASIDAHGFTSNYSAQYRLGFDVFKNKLTKELISHSGAPKMYPNLYLNKDTFIDTIRVNGPNAKKMKLYFNPEYYHIQDGDDRTEPVIATRQKSGGYEIQVINLDNQKSQKIAVSIDDRIKAVAQDVDFPTERFGIARKIPASRQ
jgi:hypothetical protein